MTTITTKLRPVSEGDFVFSDQAVQALVGQTPRINWLDAGVGTITRAWVRDGWIWADLEVPDERA